MRYPILIFDMKSTDARADAVVARDATQGARSRLSDAKAAAAAAPTDANKAAAVEQAQADVAQNEAAERIATERADDLEHLYWKSVDSNLLVDIPMRGFAPKVYTTQTLLILVCNAKFGDGSNLNQVSVAANAADPYMAQAAYLLRNKPAVKISSPIDRVFMLENVKDNAVSEINFTLTDRTTTPNAVDPIAWALVERHRIIHFSAGGGLLLTRATPQNYSLISVPTITSTTTTVTATTTVVTTNTTTGAVTTQQFTSDAATTTATATGSASYVLKTKGQTPQFNSVAGVTWYPFGRDTFPVTKGHGFTTTYGWYSPRDSIGVFLGTSVNTLGNFTVGPSYEVFPGIQVFGGATWWNKTTLQSNIISCSGYGTSQQFQLAPTSSKSETTTSMANATATAPATTTNVLTLTTVGTSATSGCSNGDRATILAGSTLPTQTAFKPAFGFGIIFNTNLLKAFSGFSH